VRTSEGFAESEKINWSAVVSLNFEFTGKEKS